MALERILKIYILECITEYIFGKTNKKGERNRGEGTKVYIAVICSFICNMYKKAQELRGTNFIIFIYRKQVFLET